MSSNVELVWGRVGQSVLRNADAGAQEIWNKIRV